MHCLDERASRVLAACTGMEADAIADELGMGEEAVLAHLVALQVARSGRHSAAGSVRPLQWDAHRELGAAFG